MTALRFVWRSALNRLRQYGHATYPRAAYEEWCERHTPDGAALAAMSEHAGRFAYQPLISVITPVWNTDPRWLRAAVESVRHQVYERWELCLADDASESAGTRALLVELAPDSRIAITRLSQHSHISAASNAALARASGDFIVLLDHDDELTPDALFEVVRFLNSDPGVDLIYSDEDKLNLDGSGCEPFFKPDWAPEHFLSCMYTGHLMAVRRSLIEELGGFRIGYEGAQDYDLVLRIMERNARIRHIPKILYRWRKLPESAASAIDAKPWAHEAARRAITDHLRRTGQRADVHRDALTSLFHVRYHIAGAPLVSIIVPARSSESSSLLARCLQSLAKTRYRNFEVVVVGDAADMPPWIRALPGGSRIRWERHADQGGFNLSDKINRGAAAAAGDHLLFLHDGIEALDGEWLEAMLEYSQIEGIGAVGAKIFAPDGRLQHIGLVLGVCGVAAHAFHQHPGSSPGYASSALGVRNYSAVSGACLMTPSAAFEKVGGFDRQLPTDFNDVDYCLRLRRAGYRTVFTPHARLKDCREDSTDGQRPDTRAAALLRERWGDFLQRDPCYNPNLTTQNVDYRLGR